MNRLTQRIAWSSYFTYLELSGSSAATSICVIRVNPVYHLLTDVALHQACLIAVAQLSAGYSALAEDAFRLCCRVRQWRLPRVPRGAAAASFRPWRTLFLSHCCRGCHRFGEYPVLDSKTKQRFGLLCRKCTQEPRIHTHMSRRMQTLQTISIDGRQLNVEGKRKRKRKDG